LQGPSAKKKRARASSTTQKGLLKMFENVTVTEEEELEALKIEEDIAQVS